MSLRRSKAAACGAAAALLWLGVGVARAQASAPAIPFRAATAVDSPGPQQWLLAVLGSAALLVGLLYLVRRFGARLPQLQSPLRRVKVVERTGLAHGTQLLVIEYEQRRLLLSVSAAGTVCLRDDPIEPGAGSAPGGAAQ